MTIEEKKQFLKRYKRAVAKIKALNEELDNIEYDALPSGIDYSKDKVQTTATSNQMINHVIRVEEMLELIHKTRQSAIEDCTKIIKAIDTINNDTYQALLHRRYILLQTWEDIAESMHYSTQRLYELHGEALAEINIDQD